MRVFRQVVHLFSFAFQDANLWSGIEKDRNSAICNWCDTDFVGTDGSNGGKYSVTQIKKILLKLWPDKNLEKPYVVCTGGEPSFS